MLFEGGFTFANFIANLFSIFLFNLWLWLLMTVFGDLFRRHDVSAAAEVAWVILLIAGRAGAGSVATGGRLQRGRRD